MTITEAHHVSAVLHAITGQTVDPERLIAAFDYLNQRAAKALDLSRLIPDGHELDAAARRLASRLTANATGEAA